MQRRIVCTVYALFLLVWPSVGVGVGAPVISPGSGDGNVQRYGAVGDGKNDDTGAIQEAVNTGAGAIHFPKGVYRITQPIVIDLDRQGFTSIHGQGVATLVMAGPGPALRFVGTHFKSADPQGFSRNVWERQRMPLVDGLAILGDHDEAIGIEAVGTMQLTVTRVHVHAALHGIHLKENNRNVVISDCHLYENCLRMNITNCSILDCDNVGLLLKNVSHSRVSDCMIRDDRLDTQSIPLKVSGGTGNMIINNVQSE